MQIDSSQVRLVTVSAFVLSAVFAPALASADPVWVEAKPPAHCATICNNRSLFPVAGGTFMANQTANPYYVCAGEAQGLRPGWNSTAAEYPATCVVGFGKGSPAISSYSCLCYTKNIKAD
jgi:hypothetical protein